MEEFEICSKKAFGTFLVNFEIEGGHWAKKGVKEDVLMCQLQRGKITFFSPGKMDIFHIQSCFSIGALRKICNSDPLLNHCFKYFVTSKH